MPESTVPNLTKEQRLEALEKAKKSRKKRADFKQKVLDQNMTCSKALTIARKDDVLDRMRVIDFIKIFPGFGDQKANLIMNKCGIAKTRRIRGLGDKQLDNLVHMIDYAAYKA